jgi:hypothetical protein
MGTRLAIMKKSKKKGKEAGKAKKKKSTKPRKVKSPAEVRQDISKLVSQHAMKMAQAVVGEGEKGQLAPTKYLLELAGVFPASDGSAPTEQEESLAETLFRKLNVPTTPVKLNDEEDEVVATPAASEKTLTTEGKGEHGENAKSFTPERTEEERVDAGEPSGV